MYDDWLVNAYSWVQSHDLPNWGVVILSLIVWPLALIWWNRRKVNNISKLLVTFENKFTRMTLDALEQSPGLLLAEDRRLPALDDVLRTAHRMRLVDGEDLADDEPVEQHADCREVLLDGRPGGCALFHCRIAGVGHLQRFDIRSDMEGLDIDEPADAVLLEPGEERAHGPVIGHAGVVVPDRGSELRTRSNSPMAAW